MNPSNRTFEGHIEPMRQPHMLIEATQALHLGAPRLSADAHEFVPFAANPAPYYQTPQQPIYTNNFQGNRFAGQQQPYSHRQNLQQQQYSGGQQYHHHHHQQQQQRLPSTVQGRLNSNNSSLDGGGVNSMYQGQPQQQHNPYHSHQQQQQLMHGGAGGGGRFNNHHHHPHHQQQQQSQNHSMGGGRRNGGGMGPTPRNASEPANTGSGDGGGQSQEEVQALEMLRETIQQLTDKPGMFEEYAMDLKEAFGDVIESRFVMSCAIEMLFEQSIMEPQCRYMGARLCHLLDTLASTSVTSVNLFRELMILKLAHDETELPLCMQQEQLKVRGTALFLSDLYVQLNSEGERIIELARSILTTMELLLSKTGPENAKCVCQALKLCGYQLEQDVGQDIEPVIMMLAKLEHELDTSSSRLIESVLKLRSTRWGRNTMAPKFSSSNYKPYAQLDEPVFYGPDGQVLTDDEASFLNANSISSAFMNGGMPMGQMGGGSGGPGGDAGGYGAHLDPDDFNSEMDPMVQEAYRQFLRGNH